MNNAATETIRQIVQSARESARRAEREYDNRAGEIQRKASQNIDLFGGGAVSQVADLASDSRRACDALYAAYQTLVGMVDAQCRPLLDQNPELQAVLEVRDFIKWLNDESEIENNFTASFNSYDLGGVASARYIPTMENKLIQSFWESNYDMWPGRADEERRQREKDVQARQEAAQKRKEVAAAKKERREAEEVVYQKALAAWRESVSATEQIRKTELTKAIEEAEIDLREKIQCDYDAEVRQIDMAKAHYEKEHGDAQVELAAAGLFGFSEKSRCKKQIKLLDEKIKLAESKRNDAKQKRDRNLQNVKQEVENRKPALEKRIAERYPLAEEPCPPGMTPTEFQNKRLKDSLWQTLQQHGELTIEELCEKCPAAQDVTQQRVSAMLRQMYDCADPVAERVENEIKRKAYFRARPLETIQRAEKDRARQMDAIYAYLESTSPCTVSQLEYCPEVAALSLAKISSLVSAMYQEGRLHRIEKDGKAYFEIV